MKKSDIYKGMKVRIMSNSFGGGFSIGTVGKVVATTKGNRSIKVVANYDWWWYRPRDVRFPKTKPTASLKCLCNWVEYKGKYVRRWHKDCKIHKQ